MPHLISNLYEKSYTPFTAKLAPKNLWQYPKLGKYLTVSPVIKDRMNLTHISHRSQATKGYSRRC